MKAGTANATAFEGDEFYVGYLPMPPRHVFYVRLLMPMALWFALGVAAVVSSSQPEPGAGVWNTGRAEVFEGRIDALPYPLLRIPTARVEQPFQTLLIVETGKFGGGKRALPYDGRIVKLSGWLIERDGRRMIELEPGEGAIQSIELPPAESIQLNRPDARVLGHVNLRGEIVDSKCFLGVMKPGEGKTHKECATLCIAGGIPPMLVTRDPAGQRSYYLLANPDGGALDRSLLPYVADPVEVSGTLEQRGDLQVLRIDTTSIRRL